MGSWQRLVLAQKSCGMVHPGGDFAGTVLGRVHSLKMHSCLEVGESRQLHVARLITRLSMLKSLTIYEYCFIAREVIPGNVGSSL